MNKHESIFHASGTFLFETEKHQSDINYTSGSAIGFVVPHIGCIVEGRGRMISDETVLELSVGDIVYIPASYRYRSEWLAEPRIRFHTLVASTSIFEDTAFCFQKITLPHLRKDFENLYALAKQNDTLSYCAAAISLYATILSHLKKAPSLFPKELLPAKQYIDSHFTENFSVSVLARKCGMSLPRFYARFKECIGTSPIDYRNAMRVRYAVSALRAGASTEEAASASGFCSASFLRRMMRKFCGVTPKQIKNGRVSM